MRRISRQTEQTISPPKPGKVGWNRGILAIVLVSIITIGGLFALIYYTSAQVETQDFSFNPASFHQSTTFTAIGISDVDGPVTITSWTQNYFLVNGTLTAKGLGSSLSIFKISNSTANNVLTVNATFPVNPGFFFSQSYTAAITVFVPNSVRFDKVQLSNVNGALILHNLNSTIVSLNTVNGAVMADCLYCLNTTITSADGDISLTILNPLNQGNYTLTSTNSNVALTVPKASSFTVVAMVENGSVGSIQVLGLPGATTAEKYLSQSFGNGTARVNLSSITGQITLTGT